MTTDSDAGVKPPEPADKLAKWLRSYVERAVLPPGYLHPPEQENTGGLLLQCAMHLDTLTTAEHERDQALRTIEAYEAIINDDGSLQTHQEKLDILDDMRHAYDHLPQAVAEHEKALRTIENLKAVKESVMEANMQVIAQRNEALRTIEELREEVQRLEHLANTWFEQAREADQLRRERDEAREEYSKELQAFREALKQERRRSENYKFLREDALSRADHAEQLLESLQNRHAQATGEVERLRDQLIGISKNPQLSSETLASMASQALSGGEG